MDESNARAILSWRYEPPYDLYNYLEDEANLLQDILHLQNTFYSIMNENSELVAYCSFGQDGQVSTDENSTWCGVVAPRACDSCVIPD